MRRWKSMFPGKSMWQLKVTRVSVLSLKSVLALLERVPAPAPLTHKRDRNKYFLTHVSKVDNPMGKAGRRHYHQVKTALNDKMIRKCQIDI